MTYQELPNPCPGSSHVTFDVLDACGACNAQVLVTGLTHSNVSQSFEKKIYMNRKTRLKRLSVYHRVFDRENFVVILEIDKLVNLGNFLNLLLLSSKCRPNGPLLASIG